MRVADLVADVAAVVGAAELEREHAQRLVEEDGLGEARAALRPLH
jgi:hypothetical protein